MNKNKLGVILAIFFVAISGALFVNAQVSDNETNFEDVTSNEVNNVVSSDTCNGNCGNKESCGGSCGGSCGVKSCGCSL